jgi:hypothetical protein
MNKRGFVITGAKKWIGLLLGILFILASIYILGKTFGLALPDFLGFLLNTIVLAWIVLVGSIFLIYDAIFEMGAKRMRSILAALIGVILGLIPVLHSFGVLPFTIPASFGNIVYALAMIILGGFLIWDFTGG